MEILLTQVNNEDMPQFKKDMQEAFKYGAMCEYEDLNEEILPEKDIDDSLSKKGSIAYKAVADGKIIGGAIVVIDSVTQHNHLDFLYVKVGVQSKGIGQKIWQAIERLHPETEVWETHTPYFEKRNLHFYINRLGFHAVEFFNPHHADPNAPQDTDGGDYFFRFEKTMK